MSKKKFVLLEDFNELEYKQLKERFSKNNEKVLKVFKNFEVSQNDIVQFLNHGNLSDGVKNIFIQYIQKVERSRGEQRTYSYLIDFSVMEFNKNAEFLQLGIIFQQFKKKSNCGILLIQKESECVYYRMFADDFQKEFFEEISKEGGLKEILNEKLQIDFDDMVLQIAFQDQSYLDKEYLGCLYYFYKYFNGYHYMKIKPALSEAQNLQRLFKWILLKIVYDQYEIIIEEKQEKYTQTEDKVYSSKQIQTDQIQKEYGINKEAQTQRIDYKSEFQQTILKEYKIGECQTNQYSVKKQNDVVILKIEELKQEQGDQVFFYQNNQKKTEDESDLSQTDNLKGNSAIKQSPKQLNTQKSLKKNFIEDLESKEEDKSKEMIKNQSQINKIENKNEEKKQKIRQYQSQSIQYNDSDEENQGENLMKSKIHQQSVDYTHFRNNDNLQNNFQQKLNQSIDTRRGSSKNKYQQQQQLIASNRSKTHQFQTSQRSSLPSEEIEEYERKQSIRSISKNKEREKVTYEQYLLLQEQYEKLLKKDKFGKEEKKLENKSSSIQRINQNMNSNFQGSKKGNLQLLQQQQEEEYENQINMENTKYDNLRQTPRRGILKKNDFYLQGQQQYIQRKLPNLQRSQLNKLEESINRKSLSKVTNPSMYQRVNQTMNHEMSDSEDEQEKIEIRLLKEENQQIIQEMYKISKKVYINQREQDKYDQLGILLGENQKQIQKLILLLERKKNNQSIYFNKRKSPKLSKLRESVFLNNKKIVHDLNLIYIAPNKKQSLVGKLRSLSPINNK